MTPRELQALIATIPECAPNIHTADMPKIGADEVRAKDQAVADAVNAAGAVKVLRPRLIGYGAVLSGLGPELGSSVLDKLTALGEQVSMVKWAMKLLDAGQLDIGNPATQAQVEAMRGSVLTDAETDGLKGLGLEPNTVSAAAVSVALRGPWGDE